MGFITLRNGEFTVTLGDDGSWKLHAGEVVLLPHNDLHVFASSGDVAPVSVASLVRIDEPSSVARIVHGGGGARTRMVCGFLGGNAQLHPLLVNLPPVIMLDLAGLPSGDWMARTFDYATRTLAEDRGGAAAVIAKASELMFVEVVRRHLDGLPPEETGWLAGLRDPAVGRALALVHARVNQDWATDALARDVSLSRPAFADRFTKLIGVPPMRYLLRWRMQVAMQKLRETRLLIAQIAFDVGYDSEAAFTRAFRRETGLPPAAWRARTPPTQTERLAPS